MVDYVEKVGFVYVVEKVDNSICIDGLMLDQLKKKLGGGIGGGKVRIGSEVYNVFVVGGSGGMIY